MITNLLPVITTPPVDGPLKIAQNSAAEVMAADAGKSHKAPQYDQLEINAEFFYLKVE